MKFLATKVEVECTCIAFHEAIPWTALSQCPAFTLPMTDQPWSGPFIYAFKDIVHSVYDHSIALSMHMSPSNGYSSNSIAGTTVENTQHVMNQ